MAVVIAAPHRDMRFGVSRVAVLLASELADSGIDVKLVWAFSPSTQSVRPSLGLVGEIPELVLAGEQLSESVADPKLSRLLKSHLDCGPKGESQTMVSLGWPFLSIAALSPSLHSVLVDAGCVPTADPSEQAWLRRLRAQLIPHFSDVIPISRFIAESQTFWDRGTRDPSEPIGLGGELTADELAALGELTGTRGGTAIAGASSFRRAIVLGRYQDDYKNSEFAVKALAQAAGALRHLTIEVNVIGQSPPPTAYEGASNLTVRLCNSLDDTEMRALLDSADVALSTSLWEGFNLPIAEADLSATQVFALARGAHPEVLLPSQLVREEDLGTRLTAALAQRTAWTKQVHADVNWKFNLARYMERIAAASTRCGEAPDAGCIFVNVTNAKLDPANSGVVRTTRQLTRALSTRTRVVPVAWDSGLGTYRLLQRTEKGHLCSFGGPKPDDLVWAPSSGLTMRELMEDIGGPRSAHFLDVEVSTDGDARRRALEARSTGVTMAGWVMDLIPVERPDLTSTSLAAAFSEFLESRLEFDHLYFLSEYQKQSFQRWCGSRETVVKQERMVVSLPPGLQPGGSSRPTTSVAADRHRRLRVVMVSTIEPRKNHMAAIAAMDMLRRSVDVELHLVGNSYANDGGLGSVIQYMAGSRPWIHQHGISSDEKLERLYSTADVCLYPSLIEGYGLPIAEAQAFGVPCIVHDHPSLEDLATRGGCLQTDCNDPIGLAAALEVVLTDTQLAAKLSLEGRSVVQPSWEGLAEALFPTLSGAAERSDVSWEDTRCDLPIDLTAPFASFAPTLLLPSQPELENRTSIGVPGGSGEITLSALDSIGTLTVDHGDREFFWLRQRLTRLAISGQTPGIAELEALVTPPPGSGGTWLMSVGALASSVYLAPGQEAERGYLYAEVGDNHLPGELWIDSRGSTGSIDGDPREFHARVVPLAARVLRGPLLYGLRSQGTEVNRWYEVDMHDAIPVPSSVEHELVVTRWASTGEPTQVEVSISNASDTVRRHIEWTVDDHYHRQVLWRRRWRTRKQKLTATLDSGSPLVVQFKVTGPVCREGDSPHVAWINVTSLAGVRSEQ